MEMMESTELAPNRPNVIIDQTGRTDYALGALAASPTTPDLADNHHKPTNSSHNPDTEAHSIPQPSSVLRDDISTQEICAPAPLATCDTTRQEPTQPAIQDAMADKEIEKGDEGESDARSGCAYRCLSLSTRLRTRAFV